MNFFNRKLLKKFTLFFLCLYAIFHIFTLSSYALTFSKINFGKDAIKHVKFLSQAPRISGTRYILSSQKYIKNEFQKYGYNVEEQNFIWPIKNNKLLSKNIIAFKKGLNNKQIIIGAHYDSTNTNGADDNASGVSILLELAHRLYNVTLPYNIKFIAFDAEEVGLLGSRHFVKNMSDEEKNNTLLYINIDSVLSGDDLYIYGDNGIRGWFRDEVLEISKKENINIKTSPGLRSLDENSVNILEGECYDYSDHVYFRHASIPFAYLESTSWDSVDNKTGYPNYRNKSLGMVLHTENDNLNYLNKNLKDKPINNLQKCVFLLYKTLTTPNRTITILTNTNNIEELKNVKYELYKNNCLINTYSSVNCNKIVINDLESGKYKIKQINNSSIKFKCNMNEEFFEIHKNGNIHILYEDINSIPKVKNYDGILINIYGDNFNDENSSEDDLYKEYIEITNTDPKVIYNNEISIEEIEETLNNENNKTYNQSLPTFLSIDSNNETNHKILYKIVNTTLLSILCSNIYSIQKSKSF